MRPDAGSPLTGHAPTPCGVFSNRPLAVTDAARRRLPRYSPCRSVVPHEWGGAAGESPARRAVDARGGHGRAAIGPHRDAPGLNWAGGREAPSVSEVGGMAGGRMAGGRMVGCAWGQLSGDGGGSCHETVGSAGWRKGSRAGTPALHSEQIGLLLLHDLRSSCRSRCVLPTREAEGAAPTLGNGGDGATMAAAPLAPGPFAPRQNTSRRRRPHPVWQRHDAVGGGGATQWHRRGRSSVASEIHKGCLKMHPARVAAPTDGTDEGAGGEGASLPEDSSLLL